MTDRFVDHLNKLYEAYAPDLSDLPTADQIMNGLSSPKRELSFDEAWQLGSSVVEYIEVRMDEYQSFSVLGEAAFERWMHFAHRHLPYELQVVFTKKLIEEGMGAFRLPSQEEKLSQWGL